jgi:hypothetical protein
MEAPINWIGTAHIIAFGGDDSLTGAIFLARSSFAKQRRR